MSLFRRASIALLLLPPLAVPGKPAGAQRLDPGAFIQRGVVAGDAGYLLLPPELVAVPTVEAVLFSPSGRYAVVRRGSMRLTVESLREAVTAQRPPPGETSLIWWDSRTRVAREVWKADTPGTSVERIEWLPGADVALILVQEGQGALTRWSAWRIARSAAQLITRTPPSDIGLLSLHVSPTRPLAVLEHSLWTERQVPQPDGKTRVTTSHQNDLVMLDQNGSLGAHVALPAWTTVYAVQWDPEGNPLLMLARSLPGQRRERTQWYSLSPRSGQVSLVVGRPAFYEPKAQGAREPASDSPLRVRLSPTVLKEEKGATGPGLLWLESAENSEKPRTLVCGDSTGGQLLPGASGVLYQSQGALWVAPLLKLERTEYVALSALANARAEQARTLSRAKQIGLALALYAQDHDETFPREEELPGALAPYLKLDGMLDGFHYSLSGRKASTIEHPSETEAGWIMGPTGRVVLYEDGHVMVQK
jgi:hypothetical protein